MGRSPLLTNLSITRPAVGPLLRRGGVYRLPDGTECMAGVWGRAERWLHFYLSWADESEGAVAAES